VDSDDYELIFEPLPQTSTASSDSYVTPPVMLIAGARDVVLARMRDVDDAISYALEQKKAGLALRRGLRHVRRLRAYDIRDLINEYFRAVLRLPSQATRVATDHQDTSSSVNSARHLSLRRMKLAAKAMPVLLGGNIEMWNRWIAELEKIPGALFITRSILPVRGKFSFP